MDGMGDFCCIFSYPVHPNILLFFLVASQVDAIEGTPCQQKDMGKSMDAKKQRFYSLSASWRLGILALIPSLFNSHPLSERELLEAPL